MENAIHALNRLKQSHKNFQLILNEAQKNFTEFSGTHNLDDFFSQSDLFPILKNFETVALAFSEFLEVVGEVFFNETVLEEIKKMPSANRKLDEIPISWLLGFHGLGMNVSYGNWMENMPIPYLHKQIYQLAVDYGYYGCSMSASTSLISGMATIISFFELPDEDEFWEFWPIFLKKEYSIGLRLMAKRAAFLAVADDEEIRASEISWWCDQIDMTPKESAASYHLQGFIENCPQPNHPEIIWRLKELSTNQMVDESIRKQAIHLLDQ